METPLRTIFREATDRWSAGGLPPHEAYADLQRVLRTAHLGYSAYVSSAITSGGYARDRQLDIMEIIQRNSHAAKTLTSELYSAGILQPESTIEAVTLGNIVGQRKWNQSDYMYFWFHVMSGVNPDARALAAFDTRFQLALDARDFDKDLYNYSRADREQRLVQYQLHADAYLDTLKHYTYKPVAAVVQAIDPEMSLGALTEKYIGQRLGSHVMRLALSRDSGVFTDPEATTAVIDDLTRLGADFALHRTPPRLYLSAD